MRNSQDKNTNVRGKELLDACKLNDFLIMNGRKVGDLFGSCTSHQWNGSSVVDYFLAPNTFQQKILNFSVDKFVPWISDHCPIHTTISLNQLNTIQKTHSVELTNVAPRFIWDKNSKERYLAGLQSEKISKHINSLLSSDEIKPTAMATEIADILINNAKDCKIKIQRKPKEQKQQSGPWFDHDCIKIKELLNKKSKLLKKDPTDLITRTTIFNLKREFRKLVKRKKRSHKESILNQMNKKKNEKNQKEFWKLLEKFSPQQTPDSLNVAPHNFRDHFKSVLTSEIPGEIPPENNEEGPLDFEIKNEELKSASSILKPGKSVGIDNLDNDMIFDLVETHPRIILKLFNTILRSSEVMPEWLMGLIVPSTKKALNLIQTIIEELHKCLASVNFSYQFLIIDSCNMLSKMTSCIKLNLDLSRETERLMPTL